MLYLPKVIVLTGPPLFLTKATGPSAITAQTTCRNIDLKHKKKETHYFAYKSATTKSKNGDDNNDQFARIGRHICLFLAARCSKSGKSCEVTARRDSRTLVSLF
jgi:hypothetical protein